VDGELVFILIFVSALCLVSYAAATLSINFDGKPQMFHPKHIQGYFIWGDDDGIHVRVTTDKEKHVFSGTMHADGRLEDIEEKSLQDDDFAHVKDHNHTVDFQYTTSGEAAGIDFYIYRGQSMDFDIYLDGAKIGPDQIFVGEEGWHPESNKFSLDYNPQKDDQSVNENQTVIITHFHWFWWGWPRGYHRHW
jgi:hypothetical protein